MRGKIIQYNGADGSGTIVVDSRQYPFVLAAWRGDSAPAVNKTVEVTFDGDTISAITAVGDDVLLKEKAAELGGKLGSLWNKIPAGAAATPAANEAPPVGAATAATATAPAAASGGAAMAGSIIDRYGKAILVAYLLFLLGSLVFNAVSISIFGSAMGKSFFDIASLLSQVGAGGGGSIKFLLVLGYISIALPMFWHDRRAWFALVIPLLAVVWAIYSVLHTLDSVGGGIVGRSIGDAFSLGFGFWLTLLAAIALAGLGVKRSLTA